MAGHNFICNCCSCCCGILRGITDYGLKNSVAAANYYAVIDAAARQGCGTCVDRCQVQAILLEGVAVVDLSAASAGLCVSGCPDECRCSCARQPMRSWRRRSTLPPGQARLRNRGSSGQRFARRDLRWLGAASWGCSPARAGCRRRAHLRRLFLPLPAPTVATRSGVPPTAPPLLRPPHFARGDIDLDAGTTSRTHGGATDSGA
jgi:hypothetical protein